MEKGVFNVTMIRLGTWQIVGVLCIGNYNALVPEVLPCWFRCPHVKIQNTSRLHDSVCAHGAACDCSVKALPVFPLPSAENGQTWILPQAVFRKPRRAPGRAREGTTSPWCQSSSSQTPPPAPPDPLETGLLLSQTFAAELEKA